MKRISRWIIILLAPAFLWGVCGSTEVRIGYFYPVSETMRNLYHNGGVEFEIEQRVMFKTWNVWTNFNYFQESGYSKGLHDKTSVHIYPLSLGVQYQHHLYANIDWYLGIGGSYTWINLHDHSQYVKQHGHKHGGGVVGKSGLMWYIRKGVFLDLFADYYYTKVSGEHSSLLVYPTSQDIGGLRTGLGIGVWY